MPQFFPILGVINCVTSLAFGVTSIPNKSNYRPVEYFNFSIAVWSVFYVLCQYTHNTSSTHLLFKLFMIGAFCIPCIYFLTEVGISSDNTRDYTWLNTLNTVSISWFPPLMGALLVLKSVAPRLYNPYWSELGPIFLGRNIYLIIGLLIGFILFLTIFRHAISTPHTFLILAGFVTFVGEPLGLCPWGGLPISLSLNSYVAIVVTQFKLLGSTVVITPNIKSLITLTSIIVIFYCTLQIYDFKSCWCINWDISRGIRIQSV
ncbi:hypothetical protein EB093_02150 [bacterium]|nr:hypothetical protein [bacterium]